MNCRNNEDMVVSLYQTWSVETTEHHSRQTSTAVCQRQPNAVGEASPPASSPTPYGLRASRYACEPRPNRPTALSCLQQTAGLVFRLCYSGLSADQGDVLYGSSPSHMELCMSTAPYNISRDLLHITSYRNS